MRLVVRTDAVMLQVKEKVKKLVIPLYVDDDGKIPRLHGSPAGRRQSSRHALSMLVATGTEENSRPAGKRKTNSLHCLRRTDSVNNNDDDIGPDMLTRAHSSSSSWHPHIIRVWRRLCWFFEPRFGLPLACRLSSTPERRRQRQVRSNCNTQWRRRRGDVGVIASPYGAGVGIWTRPCSLAKLLRAATTREAFRVYDF